MNDPKRLLETASLGPEARAMLEAHPKTPAMPAQLKLHLGAQITKMPPASSGLSLVKGGFAALLLLAVGSLLWPFDQRDQSPAASPATSEIKPVRQTRFVALPAVVQKKAETTTTKAKATTKAKRANSLAEELKILDEARTKLQTDPNLAIEQVKLHTRRYPNGQLVDLRDYLEIRISERQGDVARTRQLREQFFSRHASSTFVQELKNSD